MSEGDQQDQQQQQTDQPQELSFNIQDILGDNAALASNDASFQAIVQNITNSASNGEDSSQAFARLPAELQQIFSTNPAEDILATTSTAGDAALSMNQQVQDILWDNKTESSMNKPPDETRNDSNMATSSSDSIPQSSQTTPSTNVVPQQTPWILPQTSMPPHSIPVSSIPQVSPAPIPAASAPNTSSAAIASPSQQPQAGATSTTLLENITSQLPPDRKQQFIELFKKLQNNAVTADQFLSQAKTLLGQQQYQQLEDLKNKPSPQGDAQRTVPGLATPQFKRPKTERMPAGMPMGASPNNPTPIFKAPAVPVSAGLQIPRTNVVLPGQSEATKPPASGPTSGQATSTDRIDIDTITDVMGYAGVDLKEEIEHFMREGDSIGGMLPDGIDRSKTQEFMNTELLRERVLSIAKPFRLLNVDNDFVSYLALATQMRLQGLLERMIEASKHRTMSQSVSEAPPFNEYGQPLYKVVIQQDVKKQLLAIERAEREEERKRKELIAERERRAQMGDGEGGGEEGRPRKKKKEKEGSQARDLVVDLRKRSTSSETALMRAIGVRKSWMLTGTTKDQQQQQQQFGVGGKVTMNGTEEEAGMPRGRGRPRGRKTGEGGKRGGFAGRDRGRLDFGLFLPPSTIGRPGRLGDPGARKITVRDAIFALERDTQSGRGAGQRTLLKTYNQWLK